MTTSALPRLRVVADYQFGRGAGDALFPEPADDLEVRRSASGRPTQIHAEEGRLVSFGTDGRFTLGLAGGRRLLDAFNSPRCRVRVGDESVPYVSDGRNAFARFVREADPALRPGDEAVIVADDLLAVGRVELPAEAMADFDSGVAVQVRSSVGTSAD